MNKQDKIIVVILFVILIGWSFLVRQQVFLFDDLEVMEFQKDVVSGIGVVVVEVVEDFVESEFFEVVFVGEVDIYEVLLFEERPIFVSGFVILMFSMWSGVIVSV